LIFVGLFGMWQSRWRDLTAGFALAVTMFLGFKHIRHLPFFLILAGAYLPVCLNMNVDFIQSLPWIKKLKTQPPLKIGVLALLGLLTAINLSSLALKHPLDLNLGETASAKAPLSTIEYPVAAVNLIKKMGFAGKILTKFGWGEYLIWDLHPQCLVALDGRYETVYSAKVQKEYFEFCYGGPHWRRFLRNYPPDLILMDRKMPVVNLIEQDPHWRQIYADVNCVLFQADKRAAEMLAKKSNSLEAARR
jgi:CheY-like chemotaxis protein